MQRKYGLILFLFYLPFFALSQSDTTKYELKIYYGSVQNQIQFCEDSVVVSPDIVIEGDGFNEDNEGIRISIANYRIGEDLLVYHGDVKLKSYWDVNYGYLELTGAGSAADYIQAVKKVYYKNLKSVPTLGDRDISVTLKDADYLPATQHFYKYISKLDITWTEARDSASKMTYNGLQGYLATITSAVENDFIWTKIDGIGWIGASDSQEEGVWKWVTGPEAGIQFWQGTYNNGGPVNGMFSYWSENEPNNAHGDTNNGVGEDYAHINQNPAKKPKSWNDLRNNGDGMNSQYYRPQGFIVEFGGMKGEPELQLSASTKISIQKIAFSENRDFEICNGESVRLNEIMLPQNNDYSYSWTPNKDIIGNKDIFNPEVQPSVTTIYTATGKLGTCESSADFNVKVNPLPVNLLDNVYTYCKGSSITLNPGIHQSYLWNNGETSPTITIENEGWYAVLLTNGFGCTSYDSTRVRWSLRPELNYADIDTLVCGAKQQKLNLSFKTGTATTQLLAMQSGVEIIDAQSLNPVVKVDKYGIYNFQMSITDQYDCIFSDTLNVGFHNQPDAVFQIDSAECEGYNLKLNFKGITNEDALYNWYSNDTLFYSGLNVDSLEIPLGFGSFNRSVGLKIDEQGCVDSLKLPVTVKPILDFWAETEQGCTPLNVQFNYEASEQVGDFYWDFGDNSSSSQEKPVHVFQNPGIRDTSFDVSLKVISSEGCENSGLKKDLITVHPIPAMDLDFEEDQCYSENAVVNYTGSGSERDTFIWDLSDFKPVEIIQDPENSPGPFEFKRSSSPTAEVGIRLISEFGCKTDLFSRTWKRKPVFQVTPENIEGCPPKEVNFAAMVPDSIDNVDFSWDFGDGNTGTGGIVSNLYSPPDKWFDVQVLANSLVTGCKDTMLLKEAVHVFPAPTANFSAYPESALVSNPVIHFENQSEEASLYEWNFGDESFISSEENPDHRFPKMGFYTVGLLAANNYGCLDSTFLDVSVAFDKIFPPNAFSPNATKEEDREFRIHSQGISDDGFQLYIFNRWGETIFKSQSQEIGWNGRMKNGDFAPAGVYTWVVQYLDFRGISHKQEGTVTLLF